jgi:hypothetical protein
MLIPIVLNGNGQRQVWIVEKYRKADGGWTLMYRVRPAKKSRRASSIRKGGRRDGSR